MRPLIQTSKDVGLPAEGRINFEPRRLDDQHSILIGELPPHLVLNSAEFQQLWDMHPPEFHRIKMFGRLVPTPRWQQAFGRDYRYTGQVNSALPVPSILERFLDWSSKEIDARLNGILVNWYDGQQGHYIGPHKDSTADLIVGVPIVTISLGEERAFKLRRGKGSPFVDSVVRNGTVIVIPYATNEYWQHAVPHDSDHTGQRISVTLRGFVDENVREEPVRKAVSPEDQQA